MNQEVKSGKILSPSTPWTDRPIPSIHVPDAKETIKATFTEPTIECPECHALVTRTAMSFNAYVCPQCDEHLKMKARDRLNWFFDQVKTEMGQEFHAKDPLHFVDSKPYPERMKDAQEKTGETEALVVMQGTIKNIPMVACAFEFDFMGGSMGTVVGDRFVQAAEKAIKDKQPLICFAASGGARMQEGMLSLMQMARTSAAIQKLKDARLPYIVVLTHPVYGGVTASLAMLGDVHIAEPKAMIGFAGKRVIEQTVREKLEEPFQRAEFLLDHGVVDQIVHRHALRDTVYRIVAKLMNVS
ncbi:acetyl-CoA carboxylase, carboxyltransferase subunit beta [Acinetobacter gerneri]|jgi:acetyl-CoA carboxylase carboxyl transferase subunit beta|uniref:Acetyl-coenzyme A carboxylase carboxyl transferase subunit beta n=1 Tax=Acinetobacter gerneri DSM 14967 = CIP 107464 = MTCC 9824 TaxID=1120926 RepID=N8ZT50_9GAMM|nr:acetyl-CoA carboxylase, carboxyltransferase subunit beta [Acinetobacter gerneri]ENV34923.1 acetyl-coenzyme A carboxylase carboxyl transferase subunit beta [Acinetobacter gerneri DSM 14967 = CIP 107464 = MTCC 9824]EPR81497.1 Acetyl-coenzyme A carboxyl transferase beta chain [Acinetobacter gerneri DSM 14967 = CIP 107464 = MTCC 9824]MCH4244484.1 acetyl-CoA carboxylase, carboxyltransferase subunit beta [Acinetobacter gerneri]MDV2439219.1 acetyl-CoA carboxylase, carboxyltransferase subunit beta [